MKVKIGNKIHNSNKEPIMIILEPIDIDNISNMIGTKYCSFPYDEQYEESNEEYIRNWMKEI